VFRIRPPAAGSTKWQYRVVYRFFDINNGYHPDVLVLRGPFLYGTTRYGGGTRGDSTAGTVFKLSLADWTKTELYDFATYRPELDPSGEILMGITLDAGGNMIVPTQVGGILCDLAPNYGCGTVYRLSPPSAGQTEWVGAIIRRFSGGDGAFPSGPVAIINGVIHGTTRSGGKYGGGNVFGLEAAPQASRNSSPSPDQSYNFRQLMNFQSYYADQNKNLGTTRSAGESGIDILLGAPSSYDRLLKVIFLAALLDNGLAAEELSKEAQAKPPGQPSSNLVHDPQRAGVSYGATSTQGPAEAGGLFQVTAPQP
jgi:hypothetical protein